MDLYLIEQTLQEPEPEEQTLDAEFGGHRVLAVMRPPTQGLQDEGLVSVTHHHCSCDY